MVRVHRGPPRVVVGTGHSGGLEVSLREVGGHSCVTHSRNPVDTGGNREDPKKIHFEYRRNRADTRGHERTRHDAGLGPSGPGFKSRAPDHMMNSAESSTHLRMALE